MRNKSNYNSYQKIYQLKRYHDRRQQAIEHLGSKCSICDSTSDLEIDHIDYQNKSFSIGKLWSVSSDRFWLELNKCQLLCFQHHKKKTLDEDKIRRPITHGKYWAAYKCKCTCNLCLDYKNTYNFQRRQK